MDKTIERKFDILNDRGILLITLSGTIDYTSAYDITEEAIRIAAAHDLKRFLYNLRSTQLDMTTIELYSLPRKFPSSRFHRIAALIGENEEMSDDMRFLENVERNIGIEMQLCTNEKEAFDWLTKS